MANNLEDNPRIYHSLKIIKNGGKVRFLDSFIEQGFIKDASIKQRLQLQTLKGLKKYLRKNNLKQTGNKTTIIERIIEYGTEEELKNEFEGEYYELTEKGWCFYNKYGYIEFVEHINDYANPQDANKIKNWEDLVKYYEKEIGSLSSGGKLNEITYISRVTKLIRVLRIIEDYDKELYYSIKYYLFIINHYKIPEDVLSGKISSKEYCNKFHKNFTKYMLERKTTSDERTHYEYNEEYIKERFQHTVSTLTSTKNRIKKHNIYKNEKEFNKLFDEVYSSNSLLKFKYSKEEALEFLKSKPIKSNKKRKTPKSPKYKKRKPRNKSPKYTVENDEINPNYPLISCLRIMNTYKQIFSEYDFEEDLIKQAINENLIEEKEIKNRVLIAKVKELQKALKEKGLKYYGLKKELSDRVIENLTDEEIKKYFSIKTYTISEKGKKYLAFRKYVFLNKIHNHQIINYSIIDSLFLNNENYINSNYEDEIIYEIFLEYLKEKEKEIFENPYIMIENSYIENLYSQIRIYNELGNKKEKLKYKLKIRYAQNRLPDTAEFIYKKPIGCDFGILRKIMIEMGYFNADKILDEIIEIFEAEILRVNNENDVITPSIIFNAMKIMKFNETEIKTILKKEDEEQYNIQLNEYVVRNINPVKKILKGYCDEDIKVVLKELDDEYNKFEFNTKSTIIHKIKWCTQTLKRINKYQQDNELINYEERYQRNKELINYYKERYQQNKELINYYEEEIKTLKEQLKNSPQPTNYFQNIIGMIHLNY